jgi:hypothetical protein
MTIPSTVVTVIDCRRGDTAIWDVTVTKHDGTAANLTGCTGKFTLRATDATSETTDASAALQVTSGAGIEWTTAASGLARITLSATQTKTLSVRAYHFDLEITDSGGLRYTTAEGLILVRNEQTRAA